MRNEPRVDRVEHLDAYLQGKSAVWVRNDAGSASMASHLVRVVKRLQGDADEPLALCVHDRVELWLATF